MKYMIKSIRIPLAVLFLSAYTFYYMLAVTSWAVFIGLVFLIESILFLTLFVAFSVTKSENEIRSFCGYGYPCTFKRSKGSSRYIRTIKRTYSWALLKEKRMRSKRRKTEPNQETIHCEKYTTFLYLLGGYIIICAALIGGSIYVTENIAEDILNTITVITILWGAWKLNSLSGELDLTTIVEQ